MQCEAFGFTFDPTVTIEGLATALAAVGAFIAYVISLVSKAVASHRRAVLGRRGRLILDVLEKNYESGVDATEVRRYLESSEVDCKQIRAVHKVRRHNLKRPRVRHAVDSHLIGLVYDHLADLDGRGHFRIHWSSQFTRDRREAVARSELDGLRAKVMHELEPGLRQDLESANSNSYDIDRSLTMLRRLGAGLTADELKDLLARAQHDGKREVVVGIAKFLAD